MSIDIIHKFQKLFEESKNPPRYYFLTGGRGSSKSFSVSTFTINLVCSDDPHIILYTRYTMKSAHISIIPEFVEKIKLLGLTRFFAITKDEITYIPNGNKILFRGIKTSEGIQTASLKSIQGVTTWILDEAEELVDEEIFDTIDLSIRSKDAINRVIIVMNPCHKRHFLYQKFIKQAGVKFNYTGIKGDTMYIYTSFLDNLQHLSKSFIRIAKRIKATNLKKYLNKFMGHWLDEAEGALWKQSTMIDCYRVFETPEFERIIVALDPNVTNTKFSDETGIIVCGKDFQYPPHYYIIKDISGEHGPKEWGKLAVAEYKNFRADNIVAETNQGGDLVEMNIKNTDINVPVKKVHATRGKIRRAEPIAGLYEQGRVHHIGYFPELELQLTTYTGDPNEESPGRFDAGVWGLTELSQNENSVGIREL